MKIQITNIIDHRDGSCTVSLDMDKEAQDELVAQGVLSILRREIHGKTD